MREPEYSHFINKEKRVENRKTPDLSSTLRKESEEKKRPSL
jgi:hypothetical protein